jgi:hypothetical protein
VSLTSKKWRQDAWKTIRSINLFPQALALELRFLPLVSAIDSSFFSGPNTFTVHTASLDAEPVVFTLAPFAHAKKRRTLFMKWLMNSLEAGNIFNPGLKSLTVLDKTPPNSGGLMLSARSVSAWANICREVGPDFESRLFKSLKQFTGLQTLRLAPLVSDVQMLPDVRSLQNFYYNLNGSNITDFSDFKNLVRLRIVPATKSGRISMAASAEICTSTLDLVTSHCTRLEILQAPIAQDGWEEKVRRLQLLKQLVVPLHPSYDGGKLISQTNSADLDLEKVVAEFCSALPPAIGPNLVWVSGGNQKDLLALLIKRGKPDAIRALFKLCGAKMEVKHRIGTLRAFIFNHSSADFSEELDIIDTVVELDPYRTLNHGVPSFLPLQFLATETTTKAGYTLTNAPPPYFWISGANLLQGVAALEGGEKLLRHLLSKFAMPLERQQQRELLVSPVNGMTLPMFASNSVGNLELVVRFMIETNNADMFSLVDFSGQNILHYIARYDSFGSRGFHDRMQSMERCQAVRPSCTVPSLLKLTRTCFSLL